MIPVVPDDPEGAELTPEQLRVLFPHAAVPLGNSLWDLSSPQQALGAAFDKVNRRLSDDEGTALRLWCLGWSYGELAAGGALSEAEVRDVVRRGCRELDRILAGTGARED